MNNREYWSKRAIELEKAKIINESKYLEQLKKEYEKALNNIQKETRNWLARFSVNNQISLKDSKKWLNINELKELKWNVEEYIKYGQENGIDLIWKKELENASAKIHISRLEALQMQIQNEIEKLSSNEQINTENFIIDTYKDSYYRQAYELQKGHNVAFQVAALDTNTIKKVISRPWTADSYTFSDRIWKNKKVLIDTLQKELTQSIIRGKAPDDIIEKISKIMGVNKNKAATLVMTESAFFSSVARKECFKNLGVEQYEIVATLDKHTSDICIELDGKKFKMSEYKEGVTAPPFHVRCRSTTAPYFDDEFEFGERAARNTNGKTYYIPSNITYNEWKEKYVDNFEKSDRIINNIPQFNKKILNQKEKQYTKQEIQSIADETKKVADKHTNNESKWSGKIEIDNNEPSAKLWSCNIRTQNITSPHELLHEQLHAHSISYYDGNTYIMYRNIEEASVEFFAQEISKNEGIIIKSSEYESMIENLRKINSIVKIEDNDYTFAKKLFDTPVINRLNYLEEKVNEYLKDKTIDEAINLNSLMEVLYV